MPARSWLFAMTDDELVTLHANYLVAIGQVETEMRDREARR